MEGTFFFTLASSALFLPLTLSSFRHRHTCCLWLCLKCVPLDFAHSTSFLFLCLLSLSSLPSLLSALDLAMYIPILLLLLENQKIYILITLWPVIYNKRNIGRLIGREYPVHQATHLVGIETLFIAVDAHMWVLASIVLGEFRTDRDCLQRYDSHLDVANRSSPAPAIAARYSVFWSLGLDLRPDDQSNVRKGQVTLPCIHINTFPFIPSSPPLSLSLLIPLILFLY